MVSLNISNVPTALYHTLLEVKGKLHARTWVEVLQWAVEDPEGEIDMEFLSVNGQPIFDDRGRPVFTKKIVFRTGTFVHEFDPLKPREEQYKLLHVLSPPRPRNSRG